MTGTLKKSIHYALKGVKHFGDERYMDFFLERENDPYLLEFAHGGTNLSDRKVLLIPENGKGWGFFAEFRAMLAKMYFAECFGLEPYVEWGEKFLYSEREEINGSKNAFEYYFEQPLNVNKSELDARFFVSIAKPEQGAVVEREFRKDPYGLNIEYLDILADMYRKYIRLNSSTAASIAKDLNRYFKEVKVLGVHFRGTDYKVGYQYHPVAVQIEQTITAVNEEFDKGGYQMIFLATDEADAIERFKLKFPDNLIYFEDVYRGTGNESIAFSRAEREYHHYRLGYEVLRDMYALSYCDGLIAGLSQVVNCARIAKKSRGEEYRTLNVINNGINAEGKRFKV